MYTLEEIVHLTGIPNNKAVEVCRLLCSEGYLIYDESIGKYSLTKDKKLLSYISEVRKAMDSNSTAQEMYSKIEDIMALGKPLALSEEESREPLKDIGVPGLNIIFGNGYGNRKAKEPPSNSTGKTPGLPRGHCILIKGAPGTGKTTLGMQIAIHLPQYRALFLTFEEDINQLCNNLDVYCQQKPSQSEGEILDIKSTDAIPFGWKKSDIKRVTRSITKIQTPSAWGEVDVVLQELITILDKELPQLIVIDSISRLRDIGGENKARQVLRRLIRMLKTRGITSIFLGEEDGNPNASESYETDGIIRLGWIGDQLTLTIDKMRRLRVCKGTHSAELLDIEDLKKPENRLISEQYASKQNTSNSPVGTYLRSGFNVFPEISVYNEYLNREREDENTETVNKNETGNGMKKIEVLDTGIPGLNALLPIERTERSEENGFTQGETVLIIGSAGAGKTLLALNFMLKGFEENNKRKNSKKEDIKQENDNNEHKKKVGVWISIEGDEATLRNVTKGFEGDLREKYLALIKDKDFFFFFSFQPMNLDLNKIVYTLETLSGEFEIERLVIDSITELERAKGGGQPEIKTFLAGLIQYLRSKMITTIFISRSDTFFRSIDKIEEEVSSLVDLIICIRNFDIHNQINKGIYIQKARGRIHISNIMRLTIDSEKGIEIKDSGWDNENLLAGDASAIQGPKVFFKLFYENPSEKEVNEALIRDFARKRYPGPDKTFTLVKKTSIYTEFWSFKGQYSSGHANTRVLCIPDYVISAFRDNGRLAEIDRYIKREVLQKIENEAPLVKRYAEKKKEKGDEKSDPMAPLKLSDRRVDAIPCYLDYGVMVYSWNLTKKSKSKRSESERKIEYYKDHFIKKLNKCKYHSDKDRTIESAILKEGMYTWKNLLDFIKRFEVKNEKDRSVGVIPFAFPPLDKKSEFVAFFMELLWSHGGDVYVTDVNIEEKAFQKKLKRDIFWNYIMECKPDIIEKSYLDKNIKELKDSDSQFFKKFKEKFFTYGLELKGIKINEFQNWIEETLTEYSELPDFTKREDVVLMLNDKPFYETVKLVLRLVYLAKVINPIDGDFRDRAILARNWYSQVLHFRKEKCKVCFKPNERKKFCFNPISSGVNACINNHKDDEEYSLLPLPLAKNEFIGINEPIYRSIACQTYWSQVMLKDALSPEIGGNFIESMNAPEYYERRLRYKGGMPVTHLEIKKEKYRQYDPESYALLDRMLENDNKKSAFRLKYNDDAKAKKKKEGGWDDELKEILENPKEDFALINNSDFCAMTGGSENISYTKKLVEQLNKRMLYSRLRQSRTAFYQVEEALHFQLKELFIKDEDLRSKFLYNENGKKINIVEDIKRICSNEKESNMDSPDKDWEATLLKISEEFRSHVVFELLTYFYHKYERGED